MIVNEPHQYFRFTCPTILYQPKMAQLPPILTCWGITGTEAEGPLLNLFLMCLLSLFPLPVKFSQTD